MWRALRISILLIALIVVAGVTWGDRFRTTRWTETLWVGVFPVNGDGSRTVTDYIAGLDSSDFRDIEVFFAQEAAVHGLRLERPVRMDLHPVVSRPPPQLDAGAGFLARTSWILRLRYYGWRMAGDSFADVRVFLVYHDAERTRVAPDSRGLQRGLMAVAHVFATESMAAQNNIVVAHEVLHTLGASDKYDPASNLPLFPEGYGEPQAEPRYPQRLAEIMAVRRAIAPAEAAMPDVLDEVVVGPATAAEINWKR